MDYSIFDSDFRLSIGLSSALLRWQVKRRGGGGAEDRETWRRA
jgi:hypothetical protein